MRKDNPTCYAQSAVREEDEHGEPNGHKKVLAERRRPSLQEMELKEQQAAET